MSLQDLGSVGEFLAAIATIATLVYLAIQIKQNSQSTKAHIRQSIADQQINYLHLRSSDPVIRPALNKARLGESLTAEDDLTLQLHAIASIRMYESVFSQHSMGTITDEDWRALGESIKFQFSFKYYRDAYDQLGASINADFDSYLRNQILPVAKEKQ